MDVVNIIMLCYSYLKEAKTVALFLVNVERKLVQCGTLAVEADSADDAQQVADGRLEADPSVVDWASETSLDESGPYVVDVQGVDGEDTGV